tara:strand:- start:11311 stop:12873 length:1563 start_codon:yes stop_codon:yes gene_type:complete
MNKEYFSKDKVLKKEVVLENKVVKSGKKQSPWVEFLKKKVDETGIKYGVLMKDADIRSEYHSLGLSVKPVKPVIKGGASYTPKKKGQKSLKQTMNEKTKDVTIDRLKTKTVDPMLKMFQPQDPREISLQKQQDAMGKINDPISILEKIIKDNKINIQENANDIYKALKDNFGEMLSNDIVSSSQLNQLINVPIQCFSPFLSDIDSTNGDIQVYSPLYSSIAFVLSTNSSIGERNVYINEPIKEIRDYIEPRISNKNFNFVDQLQVTNKSDLYFLNLAILDNDRSISYLMDFIGNIVSLKSSNDIRLNVIMKPFLGNTKQEFGSNISYDNLSKLLKMRGSDKTSPRSIKDAADILSTELKIDNFENSGKKLIGKLYKYTKTDSVPQTYLLKSKVSDLHGVSAEYIVIEQSRNKVTIVLYNGDASKYQNLESNYKFRNDNKNLTNGSLRTINVKNLKKNFEEIGKVDPTSKEYKEFGSKLGFFQQSKTTTRDESDLLRVIGIKSFENLGNCSGFGTKYSFIL